MQSLDGNEPQDQMRSIAVSIWSEIQNNKQNSRLHEELQRQQRERAEKERLEEEQRRQLEAEQAQRELGALKMVEALSSHRLETQIVEEKTNKKGAKGGDRAASAAKNRAVSSAKAGAGDCERVPLRLHFLDVKKPNDSSSVATNPGIEEKKDVCSTDKTVRMHVNCPSKEIMNILAERTRISYP
jgi:hypothetical protein